MTSSSFLAINFFTSSSISLLSSSSFGLILNNDKIKATPLNGEDSFYIENNSLVSMNMFAFTPKIFELLENEFDIFFKDNKDNLQTCEYLLPDVVCKGIKDNKIKVKALSTTAVWYGMTYKEDKELLVNAINEMVKQGLYPDNLWN